MNVKRMLGWRRVLTGLVLMAGLPVALAGAVHNVILFVPDGLRAAQVNTTTAPALAALRDEGVNFVASHSLFPTFTTANASAFATGHLLGDTGDFSNTIYTGFPVKAAGDSVTPFLESDAVLAEIHQHFAGNYLTEESILAAARHQGIQTAAIGKLGPVAIQDLTTGSSGATLIVDDRTGQPDGLPILGWESAFESAGLAPRTPGRGANGNPGDFKTPGTTITNAAQQDFFRDVVTRVVLPRFKANRKPFLLVFWSRDPDGTQHNQGDSLDQLTPGINGPTSLAAVRGTDQDLAAIRAALQAQGLLATTDILVAADHGFSTISKHSSTSPAAQGSYPDVPAGALPPGFLAIDLAQALQADEPGARLFDPLDHNATSNWASHQHPKQGSGLIGTDPDAPEVVVAANGGSDLIYLPQSNAPSLARKIVLALLAQDYTSGVFVNDRLGSLPGTLPLSSIGLIGNARTPTPSIIVSFRSFATGCDQPVLCTAEVADTVLQQGQGMHGSFSRADTWNFMAASGPDFRKAYRDLAPASNADIGRTIACVLHLKIAARGRLVGRVLSEALIGGREPKTSRHIEISPIAANGLTTELHQVTVGSSRYNDVAGFPNRTVGLSPLGSGASPP